MMTVDPTVSWLIPKQEQPKKEQPPPLVEKVQATAFCRFPALHIGDEKKLLAFCSAGALWVAESYLGNEFSQPQKLTDNCSQATHPVISPDGKKIAYCSKINTIFEISIYGHQPPTQLTYHGCKSYPVTYLSNDTLVYASNVQSSFRKTNQLYIRSKDKTEPIALSSASEVAFSEDKKTIFFTRQWADDPAKRYQGGWIKDIWRWSEGNKTCDNLTDKLAGHCYNPMYWDNKLYFLRHHEGVTNIFSMNKDGSITQHTFVKDFDIQEASLSKGVIAYRWGASLYIYNCDTQESKNIPFVLTGDAEHARDRWIEKPEKYITDIVPSSCGKRALVTCRGQIFILGTEKKAPRIAMTGASDIRYQMARFIGQTDTIIALSDQDGEQAFWKITDGGKEKISKNINGRVMNYSISPSGQTIFCYLWRNKCEIIDFKSKESKQLQLSVEQSVFSPDSKRIAIEATDVKNRMNAIYIYDLDTHTLTLATSDRTNSYAPIWTENSQHLLFFSDRHFTSKITHGWAHYGQGVHFDKMGQICHLPLARPFTSWFEKEKDLGTWDLSNLFSRIEPIDGEPQKIDMIFVTEEHLFAVYNKTLWALKRSDPDKEWKEICKDIKKAKITENKKHILLIDKDDKYHIAPANGEKIEKKKTIDLADWKIQVSPKIEWRQRFEEAWRNQRDLFYDPKMHGIDWNGVKKKYLPHLELVTSNEELNDLLKQMVGELGALHHFVRDGDNKKSEPEINQGYLGAHFEKCDKGFKIRRILETNPDDLSLQSPLRTFDQKFKEGDIVVKINGRTWNSIEEALLEMNKKNVALTLLNGKTYEIPAHDRTKEVELLHHQWVYQNRKKVDARSQEQIGYVQMRDMSEDGLNDFSRQFYSQIEKRGMILDIRRNFGGNVDHLILEKLLKEPWMHLKDGHGVDQNMMVDSFDGPFIALCDSTSYSDAETFLLAFRKLKLGGIIGSRTWGGGIWLVASHGKGIDQGLTTIPSWGCYDRNGDQIIENKGIEPDIVVINDPKEEFEGYDAVLEAGIAELLKSVK